jgi:hypothetical protein
MHGCYFLHALGPFTIFTAPTKPQLEPLDLKQTENK